MRSDNHCTAMRNALSQSLLQQCMMGSANGCCSDVKDQLIYFSFRHSPAGVYHPSVSPSSSQGAPPSNTSPSLDRRPPPPGGGAYQMVSPPPPHHTNLQHHHPQQVCFNLCSLSVNYMISRIGVRFVKEFIHCFGKW